MTSITKFDSEIYSEELYPFTEADYNEVMQASAVDDDFAGYGEWSRELESEAWQRSKDVNGILIKKACEHTACPHTRCAKSLRVGGIEI